MGREETGMKLPSAPTCMFTLAEDTLCRDSVGCGWIFGSTAFQDASAPHQAAHTPARCSKLAFREQHTLGLHLTPFPLLLLILDRSGQATLAKGQA